MGTQQSGPGHGQQQGQQSGNRPQQDRDLQRNKESDRGQPREQKEARGQQSQQNVHGEGNYAASRQYNDATKEYAESGRAEADARAAAPKSDAEAQQMDAAEAEGKRHAKGEDPALNRRSAESSSESTKPPRPGHEEE